MTYLQWLKDNYSGENHRFGDLFNDINRDITFPGTKSYFAQKTHLENKRVMDKIIQVHLESYLEYEKKNNIKQEFKKVKEKYTLLREDERKKIIDMLNNHGYTKKSGNKLDYKGGSGLKNYTSIGELQKPYDLKNWKWIKAYKKSYHITISLNALDQDKSSRNFHALYDRISIKCESTDRVERIITNLDLPLEINELNELIAMIDGLCV